MKLLIIMLALLLGGCSHRAPRLSKDHIRDAYVGLPERDVIQRLGPPGQTVVKPSSSVGEVEGKISPFKSVKILYYHDEAERHSIWLWLGKVRAGEWVVVTDAQFSDSVKF